MTTRPDEKRPYSTAYGFGSTATESIASSGSDTWFRPVAGVDERARTELDARLAGTPALDADAARHFDDAREQPQRRLEAAARRELLELLAADRVARRQRALVGHHGARGDDLDALRDPFDRQVDRDVGRLARPTAGGIVVVVVKPGSDATTRIFARRQAGDAEMAVLFTQKLRDLLVGAVLDDDLGARQTHGSGLRRHDALNGADGGLRLLRHGESRRQPANNERQHHEAHDIKTRRRPGIDSLSIGSDWEGRRQVLLSRAPGGSVQRSVKEELEPLYAANRHNCIDQQRKNRAGDHIDDVVVAPDYMTEVRETKLGPEIVTRDIPNVSEEALRHLDEDGIVRIGAEVHPGDILVGKITPKGEQELSSEERLLRAIFGEKAKEVRDTSQRMSTGKHGKVVGVKVFSRANGHELKAGVIMQIQVFVAQMRKISVGDKLGGRHGNKGVIARILPIEDMPFMADGTPVDIVLNPLGVPSV